jgi:uncharacterized protein YjiS (DUF1127 family)
MLFLHITPGHSTLPLCAAAFYKQHIKSAPPRHKDEQRVAEKGRTMFISYIAAKIAQYRRYRDSVRELSRLSDRDLSDLGISRSDIEFVSRQSARA